MWEFRNRVNTKNPITQVPCNTIADFINTNKNLTKFRFIMRRAGLESLLAQNEEKLTVFIPTDDFMETDEEFYKNMDIGTAKEIMTSCILPRQIDGYLIASTPYSYYTTKNRDNRMFITSINGVTTLNDISKVVQFDRVCANGVIHFTTSLLFPTDNTYLN